ncbi:thiol-disulfide oxidoreductase [Amylibacter kogurei]|uniref:Thiol-disulfide oxidoreductase n=1 Tax=Paramylibacter kogurei TaxID=1889778 RepID=A0A2G5K249_9RHOB|nr:DsbA family protein [Amylibacter kogurei]PIB23102.1 thiol-disulfide oxidoreductase [Amylibacter kogurei]
MSRTFPMIIAAIVLIAAGGFAIRSISASDTVAPEQTVIAQATTTADSTDTMADTPVANNEVVEMVLGDPDAPITIVEYASFTCPHCRTFHENVYPDLKKNFIDTGKVKFVFREVYFDRLGLWAGMLARCGGEDKYFGLADMIFKTQQTWTAGDDGATIAQNLYKIGRIAGMDDAQMEQCLQNKDHAEALVATYQKNSEADNVRSTPTLIINGESNGNMSYAQLAEKLNAIAE